MKRMYVGLGPADVTNIKFIGIRDDIYLGAGHTCESGEVTAGVFDRYRIPTYVQADFKPYIIVAVMLASRFENPVTLLEALKTRAVPRSEL